MSNDLENTDLFKVPFYSKELLTVVEKSFDGKISPENAIKEVKNIISSEDISTEDLTSALDFLHNFVEDKNLAKDVMDVVDIAVKHSQAGHTCGKNEKGQYYEVNSNVEAKNLSTEILDNHPEMENRVFEVYERVSKSGLPIYHDLAYVSAEHPKAINLFLQKHNTDDYADSLYRAADAMRYLLDNNKNNPEVMLTVGRMVENYNRRKNKLKGANSILPDMYKGIMTSNLKEKIEQIRAKKKINNIRKEEKAAHVDRLEQKMHFIEKRVQSYMDKENKMGNSKVKEDIVRLNAYKDFSSHNK